MNLRIEFQDNWAVGLRGLVRAKFVPAAVRTIPFLMVKAKVKNAAILSGVRRCIKITKKPIIARETIIKLYMSEVGVFSLIARRLCGEANDRDLEELNSIVQKDPDASFLLDLLLEWWGRTDGQHMEPDPAAFASLMRRIRSLATGNPCLIQRPNQG